MKKSSSNKFLIMILLCLTTLIVSLQPAYGSQELIQNGGFETGDLRGWNQTNSYVLTSYDTMGEYDAMSHPPHTGSYSADIGTVTSPGTISQTVTIPPESSTAFSAWYRVEPGSSLNVYLKASDGSVIKQWSLSGSSSSPVWSELTYTLDTTYADKQVTVEIDGIGYETSSGCYVTSSGLYVCLYSDYFAFVDDISMVASLAEYVAQITVTGLSQGLSANISVDGQPQSGGIQEGQNLTLTFSLGTSHVISIDQYVSKNSETRYFCANPSVTVGSGQSIAFDYRPQYYLAVSSPYGSVVGGGWYNQSSEVSISVAPTSVPLPGLLGLLGARYVFQEWTGDVSGTSTTLSVLMDGPKSISAVWAADYTFLYITLGVIVGCFFLAAALLIRRHGKTRRAGTEIFMEDDRWGEPGKTELRAEGGGQKTEIFREEQESKKQERAED